MITVLSESIRKARKQHICRECLKPIEIGSYYTDQRNADNGIAWTYRAHTRCLKILHAQACDPEDIPAGYIDDLLDGHDYNCAGATKRDFQGCDCGELDPAVAQS